MRVKKIDRGPNRSQSSRLMTSDAARLRDVLPFDCGDLSEEISMSKQRTLRLTSRRPEQAAADEMANGIPCRRR